MALHHKALMKISDEESLLQKMGVELQSLDFRMLRNGRAVRVSER